MSGPQKYPGALRRPRPCVSITRGEKSRLNGADNRRSVLNGGEPRYVRGFTAHARRTATRADVDSKSTRGTAPKRKPGALLSSAPGCSVTRLNGQALSVEVAYHQRRQRRTRRQRRHCAEACVADVVMAIVVMPATPRAYVPILLTNAAATRATTAAPRTRAVQIFVIGVPSLCKRSPNLTLSEARSRGYFRLKVLGILRINAHSSRRRISATEQAGDGKTPLVLARRRRKSCGPRDCRAPTLGSAEEKKHSPCPDDRQSTADQL